MELELDKTYVDRKGKHWTIISLNGPRIGPVTGARWEEKDYRTRTFQRDGHYWQSGIEDNWDLIALVTEKGNIP